MPASSANSPAEGRHAIVVGAGIAGLSTAYRLLRLGWRVSVIDKGEPGQGCSAGNAGAVSPGSVAPLASPGLLRQLPRMLCDRGGPLTVPVAYWAAAAPWLLRFVAASRRPVAENIAAQLKPLLEPALEHHRRLLNEVGAPELLRATGQLHVYRDVQALAKDEFSWNQRRRLGVEVLRVDRAGIEALEPAVGPLYTVGCFLPQQGMIVDPLAQTQAIAQALTAGGAQILRDEVTRISISGASVTGVEGSRGRYQSPYVVVCAGAWSARLLEPLGYRVPLESQRGYHATLPDAGIQLRRVVTAADRKIFTTPMRAGLRVAGTVEFGGLNRPPTERRARLLLDHCRELFPDVNVSQASFWMGHRPCLPDSKPVLGPSPRHRGLAFNFGHGHLGLTMGPVSGHLVAGVLDGAEHDAILAPFSIGRFPCRANTETEAQP